MIGVEAHAAHCRIAITVAMLLAPAELVVDNTERLGNT